MRLFDSKVVPVLDLLEHPVNKLPPQIVDGGIWVDELMLNPQQLLVIEIPARRLCHDEVEADGQLSLLLLHAVL
eukprot:6288040-Pyramimonas_sp.AAC.1